MNKEFKFALLQSFPVLVGFLFIGAAFGLLMTEAGYGIGWAVGMSVFVLAGSLQFALIPLMQSGASLLTVAILSLSISSRQMVYGLSFLDKFKKMGKKYLFMIFSLCDETYSILCADVPEDIDRKKFDFYVAALDMSYWVLGTALGSLFGSLIAFDTTGIDFAMTALFVVIVVEQWLGSKNHTPALVGLVCGAVCLGIFGPDNFILPALIRSIAVMMLARKRIEEV